MTLLDRVAALLANHDVAHALIGAAALAVHGVSRSTLDQDLLVCDRRVLESGFWQQLAGAASVDIRHGDSDDPLAGVVRISEDSERVVDVVVGRHQWQQGVLARSTNIGSHALPVAQRSDLILLKLFAGGSQDKWDIEQLLAIDSSRATLEAVDAQISSLPAGSRAVWASLRPRS